MSPFLRIVVLTNYSTVRLRHNDFILDCFFHCCHDVPGEIARSIFLNDPHNLRFQELVRENSIDCFDTAQSPDV